jgi:hypothetical protein
LKKAIELRPDYYEAQRELAYCYHSTGATDLAIKQYVVATSYRAQTKEASEYAANNLALAALYRKKGDEIGGVDGEEYKKTGKACEDDARKEEPDLKRAVKKLGSAGVLKFVEEKAPPEIRNVLKGFNFLKGDKTSPGIRLPINKKLPVNIRIPINKKTPVDVKLPIKTKIPIGVKIPIGGKSSKGDKAPKDSKIKDTKIKETKDSKAPSVKIGTPIRIPTNTRTPKDDKSSTGSRPTTRPIPRPTPKPAPKATPPPILRRQIN